MPNRVPLQSVVVQRDGQAVTPPIGAVFNFTAEEVADIERSNPAAISEKASVDADEVEVKSVKGGKGGTKKAEEL